MFEHSSDSESIEVLSGHENSENEEFLGYYTVGPDGKKRPIPAPRRLVRIPAANGSEADASSPVTQDSSSTPQSVEPKTGKEVVFAEVRRHRISLSDDSQGRDLTLIPPGYDGHSMLNTLPHQTTVPQPRGNMLNTLPQYQSTEEAWYRTGPEFQRDQKRFRTYGNEFHAGVVLPNCTGPRPLSAPMHNTTKTKPTDIRVDDNNILPPRPVAFATACLPAYLFRKTRAGFKLEKEMGPGLVAPPRRANLLGNITEGSQKKGPEVTVIETTNSFPSTGIDAISPHQKSPYFIKD